MGIPEAVRWQIFRPIAKLSAWCAGAPRAADPPAGTATERWLWLFVSTIGELNAIEPMLRALLARSRRPLLLLTDHPHYCAAFLAKFPEARVQALADDVDQAGRLARAYPPQALLLAEIPCLLHDAPCRLPYALLRAAKRAGAPVCVVNAWLYRTGPSCRLDRLEQAWFGRDYLGAIDLYLAQTEAVRTALIAAGVPAERVQVSGNIKFDVFQGSGWMPKPTADHGVLEALRASGRPRVVSGCITNLGEQELILDAFLALRRTRPDALLVLAPRHPENAERMRRLDGLLRARGLDHLLRSRATAADAASAAVLVLDTMGELRDFYGIGDACFVGLNHNVLEPLALGQRVFVNAGWDPAYPSYPVYATLRDAGLIDELEGTPEAIAEAWRTALAANGGDDAPGRERRLDACRQLAGASVRVLAALETLGVLPPAVVDEREEAGAAAPA